MVYLIDDKKSRQQDYGWDAGHIEKYGDVLCLIYDRDDLEQAMQTDLFQAGNVILLHESFLSSSDSEKSDTIGRFSVQLSQESENLYVACFSGSKCGRYVNGKSCMLAPDILYRHLDVFLNKVREGEINFEYLAFGEHYAEESELLGELEKVINEDSGKEKVTTSKKLLFAVTADSYALESPFKGTYVQSKDWWDLRKEPSITDVELDCNVRDLFSQEQYDAIYIPLCFGSTLSDYMGLRLAMHIRLTPGVNQFTPLFIYGVVPFEKLRHEEFFDVLKMKGVSLIGFDRESIVESEKSDLCPITPEALQDDLTHILINVPSNIGDNHSVANMWAIYRWKEMLDFGDLNVEIKDTTFLKTIYFKFLVAKFGEHQKIRKNKKVDCRIGNIEGKKIVYIDDEYDKGWESIMSAIFKQSGASFCVYKDFNKKDTKEKIIEKIKKFVDANNDADCFLLDLRLHELDFKTNQDLTGHKIAEYIKERNEGNQIVVISASDKIWNLRKEIFEIKATGYALKESPAINMTAKESEAEYKNFSKAIRLACTMSFLKELVNKATNFRDKENAFRIDDALRLMSIDNGEKDQCTLGAAMLSLLVFIEDTIGGQGYKVSEVPIVATKKVYELISPAGNVPFPLTGHMFFKREENNGHPSAVKVDYYKAQTETPNGFSDPTDSDVTKCAGALYQKGFPSEIVNLYINCKYIRNTQIAHGGERKTRVTYEMITNLLHNIIFTEQFYVVQ